MVFDAASPPDLPAAPALAFALLDGIRAALLHDPRRAREELGRLDRLLDETARFGAVRGGLAPWQERRVRRLVEAGIDGPLPVDRAVLSDRDREWPILKDYETPFLRDGESA